MRKKLAAGAAPGRIQPLTPSARRALCRVYSLLFFCVNQSTLAFRSKQMTDRQLSLLARVICTLPFPQTSKLSLDMNQLTSIPVEIATRVSAGQLPLSELSLSRNPLQPGAISPFITALLPAEELHRVDLVMCKLSGQEAGGALGTLIARSWQLTELNLGLNFLSGPGISAMLRAFPKHWDRVPSLQVLTLDNNLLSNKDADVLCGIIVGLPSLLALSVQCNKLGPYAGKALGKTMRVAGVSLQSLNVSHNNIGDDGLTGIISGAEASKSMRSLYLGDIHASSKSVIESIERLSYGDCTAISHLSFDMNRTEINESLVKAVERLVRTFPDVERISLVDGSRPPLEGKLEVSKDAMAVLRI